jgi:hypothetical protein
MGKIVRIDDIKPAFNNAHRVMWAKHSGGRVLSQREANVLPAQWWNLEYGVKIIRGHKVDAFGKDYYGAWVEAEFASEEELSWFMLRWS